MNINVRSIYNQRLSEIQSRVPVRIFQNNSSQTEAQSSNVSGFSDELNIQISKNSNSVKAAEAAKNTSAYAGTVSKLSQKYGVNNALVNAVIKAESGFNPNAVSKAGAIGLMQLMPSTARGLGVTDPFNPEQNLDGGIRYIKQMLDRYNGDVKMALAAYNAGSGTLNSLNIKDLDDGSQFSKLPSETKNYINTILNYMRLYY